jgi:hypothetical protein
MRLSGKVAKDGRFWLIEVPLLDALTQGRTRREAFEMLADLVATMAGRPALKLQFFPGQEGSFELAADDVGALIALVLRRQRQKSGLSLAAVAAALGARSRNEYARYEQGRALPSLDKLDKLLRAVAADRDLVLAQSCAEPTPEYKA